MNESTPPLDVRDRQALMDTMAEYARSIDERDMDGFRSIFHPDVEVNGFGPEPLCGAETWVEFVSRAVAPYAGTQHMLGPQLVSFDGSVAHARTDLRAIHVGTQTPPDIFTVWGTYHTELTREEDRWLIIRHRLDIRAVHNTNG